MIKNMVKYFIIFCCAIMLLVLVIGGFVIKKFKESEPYKVAVKDAYSNPKIAGEIGKVNGIGYMVAGEISKASADLTFTVQGEKSDLKVYYLLAKTSDGNWIIKELSW